MKGLVFTLLSALAVLIGIGGSCVMGYRAYKESERNREIAEEIRDLQDEARRIDQENRKLNDRIEYLQSDTFREREAKRVLEYQKAGEKVVFIRDRVSASGSVPDISSPGESFVLGASKDAESNPLKWWREFFGKS